jgi:hypothetical protein
MIIVHGRRYTLHKHNAETVFVANSRGKWTAQIFHTWAWTHGPSPMMSRSTLLIGAPEAWTIPERQAVITAALALLEQET